LPTFSSFAVLAFLCLLFRGAMKWIGLMAILVLFYFYPLPFTALLVVASVALVLLSN